MSGTNLVPVEEYLRYSENPNCEYRPRTRARNIGAPRR
jgi:hypothetical protein